MSTQTLTRRPTTNKKLALLTPVHVSATVRLPSAKAAPAGARPAARPRPRAAVLAEVEERLLAAAISHHADSASALDRMLDDLDLMEQSRRGARRELPAGNPNQHERMEDLLLEAVVRTHPNRDAALSRLLGDVCGDAALDDCDDEELERARFDMSIDNDFDGLG